MALNLQEHSYCIAHGPRARGFERQRTFSKDLQRPYIADSSESTIGKGVSTKSISGPNNIQGVKDIFISPLSILLLAFPVLIMAHVQNWGDGPVFWLAFTAMIPLAKILGDATEELAMNLNNDMLSGLLNATFGNAVELIMVIAFLRTHEYMIVKFTCIGSVLSNMLLVLGMSFFAGGLVATPPSKRELEEPLLEATIAATIMNKQQKYSSMGAMVNTTLLLLSCLGLSLVTVFNHVDNVDQDDDPFTEDKKYMLPISRVCSVLIILAYVANVVFQLYTHAEAIASEDEDDGGEKEANMTLTCSLLLLASVTVIVAGTSEFLSGALEGALKDAHLGQAFVGIILLPIVGNAVEHAAAIRFAMADKAGLSVGIAVGSAVQIQLLVAPLAVLMGWAIGPDDKGLNMDLDFGILDVTVLTMSVIVVMAIVMGGKSNWLQGYMLMTAYGIVTVLYWYLPDSVGPEPVKA